MFDPPSSDPRGPLDLSKLISGSQILPTITSSVHIDGRVKATPMKGEVLVSGGRLTFAVPPMNCPGGTSWSKTDSEHECDDVPRYLHGLVRRTDSRSCMRVSRAPNHRPTPAGGTEAYVPCGGGPIERYHGDN